MGKASRQKGGRVTLNATLANLKAQVCLHCAKRKTPRQGTLWCSKCRDNAKSIFAAHNYTSAIWPPKPNPNGLDLIIEEMEALVGLDI